MDIVKSEGSELANHIDSLKGMNPEEVSQLTVNVVETTRVLNETNAEIDILSGSLVKLSKTKDEYDRKVKIIRGQLTDLAVKL